MFEISKCSIIDMPMIGFGTWQIPKNDAERLVKTALKVGYNHIDCAEIYRNEAEIGKCFGNLEDRRKIYIVSKLWCDDHPKHKVLPAINKTLKNLQIDYLDMYLIHNPIRFDESSKPIWYKKEWILETWREMVKLKDDGKSKRIGVSNFSIKKIQWLLDEDETPSNNQVELHPFLPQHKLINFCKENKIVLTGYSTIGTPATSEFIPGLVEEGSPVLLNDPCISEISKKNSVTPAQVLIKWGISRGYPVLVKSSSETRMKENLEALNIDIPQDDLERINKIKTNCRYCTMKILCSKDHNYHELFDD